MNNRADFVRIGHWPAGGLSIAKNLMHEVVVFIVAVSARPFTLCMILDVELSLFMPASHVAFFQGNDYVRIEFLL